jgi:enediyne biosynthesis protein CalE5
MPTAAELREKQRTQWSAAAEGWERWHEWNGRQMRSLTEWFCEAAAVAPGRRVLDLASGAGLPSLAMAARVRPGGRVVATDLSAEMLRGTERRARAAGLDTVEFHEMDAEHLRFEDASFDAVTCCFGLMFCPDPPRAVSEMRRVLKPGGRFAIAVWDDLPKSPFFVNAGGSVARVLGAPPPDPSAPSAFRLSPPGELASALRAGGLKEFAIESHPMMLECESIEQYWEMFTDLAAGIKPKLASVPDSVREQIVQAVREAATPYLAEGKLRQTATALCASGRV